MDLRSAAANIVWGGSSLRAWRDYRRALRRPAAAQERRLLRYLSDNRETAFGRAHDFAGIRSVDEYRARVPMSTYADLEPFISEVQRGRDGVLTATPVERLVPSGGSTAGRKLIPFTAPLRREFSVAIQAWLVDLFMRHRSLVGGPAYWSITPAASFHGPAPGTVVPIGFDDDSAYLGGARQALARAIMAVPRAVGRLRDATAFRYATVLFLLRARDLRLISVWHPSFLDGLLDVLDEHRDRLIRDIAAGTFSPPAASASEDHAWLRRLLPPDPIRAAALRAAKPGDCRAPWPKLALISSWADGHSRGPSERLALRFPGVAMQAKGLLATEGVVTIPFADRHPLAVRSHVFEFIDTGGSVRLAHELHHGGEYSVVLTTGGGLYRYKLADRVRVDGFVDETPSLQFVGKEDRISDWFGEKLTDGFVAGVLQALFGDRHPPRFALLAPERYPSGMAYTLFVDAAAPRVPRLDALLEQALRTNPQYAWCVDLGQLRPARVTAVGSGAARAYLDACVARGQRLGDVKPAALRPDTGWADVLPCDGAAQEAARC